MEGGSATGARPLVIVGGGPAGIAAAIEAGRAGLRCTLIDEALLPGGQIYRRPPDDFKVRHAGALGKDFVRGPPRITIRTTSAILSQALNMQNMRALVTLIARSAIMKIPGVPVVPEVVASV